MDPIRTISELMKSILDQVGSQSNTSTVFGAPEHHGDVTIIPVGEVSYRFGAGAGGGTGPANDGAPDGGVASGGGGGGGGAVNVKPVGYIELSDRGANYVQFLDLRRIITLGIICSTLITLVFSPAIRDLLMKQKR